MLLHRKSARTPLTALSIPQRLYLVPRLSLWLLPCLLVLLPQSSLADTIIFYHLSDTITVSVTDPIREIVGPVGGDSASVTIGPPSDNATPDNLFVYLPISEPGPAAISSYTRLSDAIYISTNPADGVAVVEFFSWDDLPEPVFQNCDVDPCTEETGGIQGLGSVPWSDGTFDGIYFQSGVDEVPEPSSVMLLAPVVGLTMFMGRRRRRTDGAALS